MKVGLISDTHGDPLAWEKAQGVIADADVVAHAGDVLYHGVFNPILETYDPRRLAELLNQADFPMVHARGNCDSEVDQLALDNIILSELAFLSVDGVRVLITHGHKYTESELVKIGSRGRVDLIHRGHTHVPEIKTLDGITFVNAGSPSLPKQEGESPTAGVLEDGRIVIYDLDSGAVLMEAGVDA